MRVGRTDEFRAASIDLSRSRLLRTVRWLRFHLNVPGAVLDIHKGV